MRHGIEIIYHASFTDEEALDMLEANRDQHFVAPGIGILVAMLDHAAPWGITRQKADRDGLRESSWRRRSSRCRKMHKRGIRVLPGGDYGFAFTPHGENARDLEYFVKYLGIDADGGAAVGHPLRRRDHDEAATSSASSRTGILADLILVDGDPLANLGILRDRVKLLAVMKDGVFYKEPEIRSAQSRWGALGGMTATSRKRWAWALALGAPVAALAVWGLADNAKLFLTTALNGLTLAALYFLVASGFTLVFGLMRNVNLAHGSLYLLGRLRGLRGRRLDRLLARWRVAAGFASAALFGLLLQMTVFRFMQGQDLRQTLVTIALVDHARRRPALDLRRRDLPVRPARAGSSAATPLPIVAGATRPTGWSCWRMSVAIGVVLWWFLNRTRVGMMIRAGVDDRAMLAAAGVNVQIGVRDHLRDRRRAGRLRRRGRRHRAVDRAGRGHALPSWPRWWWSSSAAWAAWSGAAIGAAADRRGRAVRPGLRADLQRGVHAS